MRKLAWALVLVVTTLFACRTTDDSAVSANIDQIKKPSTVSGEDFASFDRRIACIQQRREKLFKKDFDRGFHLKIQGCLKGTFQPNPNLPANYKVGVFGYKGQPRNVWVRLSNINQVEDGIKDLRGLALKVYAVAGQKILAGDKLNGQDFLMNDINTHFLNSPTQVVRSSEITSGAWIPLVSKTTGEERKVMAIDIQKDPTILQTYDFKTPLDGLILQRLATAGMAQLNTPKTLLHREYHSRAQFALGNDYVLRYYVKACDPVADENASPNPGADPLQADLAFRAKKGLCLKMMAQVRDAPIGSDAAWLDEHTDVWPAEQFPHVEFATIRFPAQDVLDSRQMATCRELHFNPFYSLAVHEPLGRMNHGRYHIYKASKDAPGKIRPDASALKCDDLFPDNEEPMGPQPL